MNAKQNVGVYGVGAYLPDQIRTNDWWSESVRSKWWQRPDGKLDRPPAADEEIKEGGRYVLEAMQKYRDDPYKGAIERRVLPEDMKSSTMEIRAAEEAIKNAGVDPKDIDFLLTMSTLPDYLLVPNACVVHEALGLNRRCFSLQTEGGCNSFLMQLALAEKQISGGGAKLGLLVQSSGTTRFMRPEDPTSAWFGDGATAVVVGPVSEGKGVLGQCHETYGNMARGLVCGIPGGNWWDGGKVHAYIERPELSRELLVSLLHESKRIIHTALSDAGLGAGDVDFYAGHQGFAWFRDATQRYAGMDRARWVDTFPWAGSLLGANIPLVMATALREGQLRDGDVVAAFGGAAGAIMTATVLRWGR